jgi:hypothetical protein
MKVSAHERTSISLLDSQLNFRKEPLGHSHEGILRPVLKPVDGAAVDEGGELPKSVPKVVSDGTHGEDNVELLSGSLNKEVKESDGTSVCLETPILLTIDPHPSLRDCSRLPETTLL